MKYLFTGLALAFISICTSCNDSTEKPAPNTLAKDTTKAVENKIMIPVSSCYSYLGKDTVRLKVEVLEHVVTGQLYYKLYEKDSNAGNFEGQLKGDTLLADYKFMSEGKISTRQVIFLIKDSIAIEGYGAMEEKNGAMIFKSTGTVVFEKGIKLKKITCN